MFTNMNHEKECIYILLNKANNVYKFGITTCQRLHKRIAEHNSSMHHYDFVCAFLGDSIAERILQNTFKQFRVSPSKLEVYHVVKEITDWINWLVLQKGIITDVNNYTQAHRGKFLPKSDYIIKDYSANQLELDLLVQAADKLEKHKVKKHLRSNRKIEYLIEQDGDFVVPPWLINKVTFEYYDGELTYDLATSGEINNLICARNVFTQDHDALNHEWIVDKGWLHPPTNAKTTGKFIRHMIREIKKGHVREIIALVPANISSSWFQLLYPTPGGKGPCHAIAFLKDRVPYKNYKNIESGESRPTSDNCLVLAGANVDKKRVARFIEVFGDIGFIMQQCHHPENPLRLSKEEWWDCTLFPGQCKKE